MAYRVIIVEDHAESAEGLAELVSLWGYEPHVAGDGERALELIDAVRPHIVIVDIGLPGMDGRELAGHIRSEPTCDDIALVALTGSANGDDAADSCFDHRLLKPVDVDLLQRLLDKETRTKSP